MNKPPIEVDKETLERWTREAKEWADTAKKRVVEQGGDIPIDPWMDEDHEYKFRVPR